MENLSVAVTDNTTVLPGGGETGARPPYGGKTLSAAVLVGTFLGIITLGTIIGNVLVCLAAVVNRRLRNITNYFVVSLAVADLLVGVLVLPFSTIFEVTRYWNFGLILCNLWVSLDVLCCTASILNLFAISLDRYYAITRPFTYSNKMCRRKAFMAIAVVWIVSLLVSFLPIWVGWNTEDGRLQNVDDPTQCSFNNTNVPYIMIVAFGTYYIPLIIMCVTYFRIFLIAKEQANRINALQPEVRDANRRQNQNLANEHKATRTLAAVLGAFIICWTPYFTVFTITPLCGCTIPEQLYSVVLWLGYINSLLNPCVYAFMNKEFRRAFKKLLCFQTGNSVCFCNNPRNWGLDTPTTSTAPRQS
ncbi:histamine H2 receptor-like [Branchiostoma floridae x Branchiostoma belcheri]